MANEPSTTYRPPDLLTIENKPEAYDYWAGTLEADKDEIQKAVRKVGPLVEDVKKELGSYGVG